MKFEIEFEFVPIMFTGGVDYYSTAFLDEMCGWFYYNYHSFLYNFRFTKDIATCGLNFREEIDQANDWDDIWKMLKTDPLWVFTR